MSTKINILSKEDLIKEAQNANNAYEVECRKNYDHEGTVKSFMLLSRLEMLVDLLKKYYDYDYDFKRML